MVNASLFLEHASTSSNTFAILALRAYQLKPNYPLTGYGMQTTTADTLSYGVLLQETSSFVHMVYGVSPHNCFFLERS